MSPQITLVGALQRVCNVLRGEARSRGSSFDYTRKQRVRRDKYFSEVASKLHLSSTEVHKYRKNREPMDVPLHNFGQLKNK